MLLTIPFVSFYIKLCLIQHEIILFCFKQYDYNDISFGARLIDLTIL